MRFPLTYTLTCAFAGIIAISAYLGYYVQDAILASDLNAAARHRLERAARSAGEAIASDLEAGFEAYRLAVINPMFAAQLEALDAETLSHSLREMQERTGGRLLVVWDSGGRRVATEGDRALAGVCEPAGDAVAALAAHLGQLYAVYRLPLLTPDGRSVGILCVAESVPRARLSRWERLAGGRLAFDAAPSLPQERGLAARRDGDLVARVFIDTRLEDRTRHNARINLLIGSTLALPLALLLSLLVARGVAAAAVKVRDVLGQIGAGALDARVVSQRKDELGDIGRAVDSMADQLQSARLQLVEIEALEKKQRELEQANDQLHRTRDQLVQAEKLASLGELLGGFAHELNNPLQSILGVAWLVANQKGLDERTAQDLRTIEQSAQRAKGIVENLLRFCRRQASEMLALDLNQVIESVLTILKGRLHNAQIEVRMELAQGRVGVVGDRGQLQQVVTNLVVNALQAMQGMTGQERPRRLTLRSWARDDEAGLEVIDTGPGVPPENRRRVFDPFFTTKPPGQGTGLGLSVSHGIVSFHRGRIELAEAPGGGALFRVVLPSDQGARAGAVEPELPARAATPAPRPGLRVLVVEDEPMEAQALRRCLEQAGYTVQTAGDGLEALQQLQVQPHYDALITDMRMPNLDGQGLHERLRVERPELARRTLLATGDLLDEQLIAFARRNRLQLVCKPFDPARLLEIVAGLCGGA